MMHKHPQQIQPVILCGGSGTRLWPLSRSSFPKQFVPLVGNKSLLQLTLERVAHFNSIVAGAKVWCIAADEHRFLVSDALQAAKVSGTVILEPVARNTAAAMCLAALKSHPSQLLLFCPSDHHIPDPLAFVAMAEKGQTAALQGAIVTFGIVPSVPSTAYGYIEHGDTRGDGTYSAVRFIEKPDVDQAQALILQGNVLWNAGIFLCKADVLINSLRQHVPDILTSCQLAMASALSDDFFIRPEVTAFTACRSESIDYAVMEHHTNIAVLPFDGSWSDVGSWNAVAGLSAPDVDGNRVEGQGIVINTSQTYINAPHRLVVAMGTQNLIIVDTPDALLVTSAAHAEGVKAVVAELVTRQSPQSVLHRKVPRPWGWYDSIDAGDRFLVKRISVKPGASLSLQKHHHRAEHWIVVKGVAEVTRGTEVFLLSENQSTYIPIGEVHRLHNPGETDLEMIEVQSGSYLSEDDIVRLDDVYGRVRPTEMPPKTA